MTQIGPDHIAIFGPGAAKCEGVVVDKDGNVYGGGRDRNLYKVTPDGKVSVLTVLPEGSVPNGIAMDRNGDLVICDLGLHGIVRVTQSGKVSLFADHAGDVKLTMPNFCTYDSDGNLFVSNTSRRTIADFRVEMNVPEPNGALVRLRPNGDGDVVARGLYVANGTAISPEEDAVFVLQTNVSNCLRIPFSTMGTAKPEVYASGFHAVPDGMAFDEAGTLFVTLPGRIAKDGRLSPVNDIIAVDRSGNWRTVISDPTCAKTDHTTNCAFGGPDMRDFYIANLHAPHFSRVRMPVPGHKLYHQR